MVTLEEAQQQVRTAEEQVLEREEQIVTAEQQAQQIRAPAGTIERQLALRNVVGGVGRGLQLSRIEAKKQREQALSQVEIAREELEGIREQVEEQRVQISEVETAREEQQAIQRDIQIAESLSRREFVSQATLGSLTQRQRRFVESEIARTKAREESVAQSKLDKFKEIISPPPSPFSFIESDDEGGAILPGGTAVGGQVLFATPEEKEIIIKAGGGTLPIFEIESEPTGKGIAELIDIETRFAGLVKPSTTDLGFGISAGQSESNLQQILLAKQGFRIERDIQRDIKDISKRFKADPESFRGARGFTEVTEDGQITFGLGESFFEDIPSLKRREEFISGFTEEGEIKPEFAQELLLQSKEAFEGLPKKTRGKSRDAEIQLAVLRTAISIPQSLINLATKIGVQTFKPGEIDLGKTGLKIEGFEFGGKAKDILDIPTVQASVKFTEDPLKFLSETIRTRPAVVAPIVVVAGAALIGGGGAIRNIRQFGLKTGTLETLKVFSPLRIRDVVFVPKVTIGTKFKGTSVEIIKGGKTEVFFKGTEKGFPEIKLQVEQISLGKGGISISKLTTPEFRFIGGELLKGTRTTQFLSTFQTKQTGAIGFTGVSKTAPLLRTSFGEFGAEIDKIIAPPVRTEFAGLSEKFPGTKSVFGFTGGERVFGFERVTAFPEQFRVVGGFRTQVSGLGLRVRFPSQDISKGIKIFRGGGTKTPLSKTFGDIITQTQQTQLGVGSGLKIDVSGITKTLPSTSQIIKTSGLSFLGLGSLTGIIQKDILKQIQTPITDIGQLSLSKTQQRQRTKLAFRQRQLSKQLAIPKQIQQQFQLPKQKTLLRLAQPQLRITTPRGSGGVRTGFFGGGGFGFAFPPLVRFPSFPLGRERRTRRGKKPKRRIQPSLTGILGAELFGFERGALPTTFKLGELNIGILPGRVRRVPKRKKIKTKKRLRKKMRKK